MCVGPWFPIDESDDAEAAIRRETARKRHLCGARCAGGVFVCTAETHSEADHIAYGIGGRIAATWHDGDRRPILATRSY